MPEPRSGLRRLGLVPTGAVAARYEYRTRDGWWRCDLHDVAQVRPVDQAASARAVRGHVTRHENAKRAAQRPLEEELAEEPHACQADFLDAVRRFGEWAANPKMLVLDTETTSLKGEVIDVALVTLSGEVLLDTRVRPTVPVDPRARAVHGISDAELAGAPAWPAVVGRQDKLTRGRKLLAYNAPFDLDAVITSRRAHGLDSGLHTRRRWLDAMTTYAPLGWERRWNGEWRWVRLADACRQQRVPPEPTVHRARGGALALVGLINALAARPPEPPDTLPGDDD